MVTWKKNPSCRTKWTLAVLVAIIGSGIGLELQHLLNSVTQREKTVAQLLRELRKEDTSLGLLGQRIWPKLPTLVHHHLGSFQPLPAVQIRRDAAAELKSRDLQPSQAVPLLIAALQDSDAEVRRNAIEILAMLGPSAKAAAPALIQIFQSRWNSTIGFDDPRGAVALALAAIAPGNPNLVSLFAAKLDDQDVNGNPTQLVGYLISALVRIAPGAPSAITALAKAADRGNAALAAEIVGAFGGAKVTNAEVLTFIERMLTNSDLSLVLSAVTAVLQLGPTARHAVPKLIEVLEKLRDETRVTEPQRSPNPVFMPPGSWSMDPALMNRYGLNRYRVVTAAESESYRQGVISGIIIAFGKIGPGAAGAIPLLEATYRSPTNQMRMAAAFARWQIDHDLESVWPVFKDGSQDRNFYTRRSTANSLAQMGDKTLPLLLEMAHDTDKSVRASVVTSLAAIGDKALPALIQALDDPEIQVRLHAIDALRALGPLAQPAAPALEHRLKDPKYVVRSAAALALKKIRPENAERKTASEILIRKR